MGKELRNLKEEGNRKLGRRKETGNYVGIRK